MVLWQLTEIAVNKNTKGLQASSSEQKASPRQMLAEAIKRGIEQTSRTPDGKECLQATIDGRAVCLTASDITVKKIRGVQHAYAFVKADIKKRTGESIPHIEEGSARLLHAIGGTSPQLIETWVGGLGYGYAPNIEIQTS